MTNLGKSANRGTGRQKQSDNVGWLWTPPTGAPPLPPTETRAQVLPLHELAWEDFERLCVRLAHHDGDIEHIQLFGVRGQQQDGIDILVRHLSGAYSVWQCKRYRKFTATQMRAAIGEFLKGEWAEKAKEFRICVSANLSDTTLTNETESQARRLRRLNVIFRPFGNDQLSLLLKHQANLVDDFFGREWVRRFCGPEAAESLSKRRLNQVEVLRLRILLRDYYARNFESVDPGLPVAMSPLLGGIVPVPLEERYVVPDVIEHREVTSLREINSLSDSEGWWYSSDRPIVQDHEEAPAQRQTERLRAFTSIEEVRLPAMSWVAESDLNVLLGPPGIGKSTLLRILILDLLSQNPRCHAIAERWASRIPVWVPFAMWSRMVLENEEHCSLLDVVTAWLHKVGAPQELQDLVIQAIGDERLMLLVDGLDEWSDEAAAGTAISLLQTFSLVRKIPVVATSRPLGYEKLGGLDGGWRIGVIAGFTEEQQRELARIWFTHHSRGGFAKGDEAQAKGDFVLRQAENFVSDVRRDYALARLSSMPLLMSGLIALSIVNVELPRSRFRAYEDLTRLLLQDHPQRREKAAMARRSSSLISGDSRDKALARLAFEIHSSTQANALDKEKARDVLQHFLVDRLGKSVTDAYEQAEQLLAQVTQSVGILVEKSQQEVGFIHRAFQEFLAARHVSRLPLEEQQKFIQNCCVSPQWHDVILCLFYLNERANEVDTLVSLIEDAELSRPARISCELLLAEAAFNDLHCSPEKARRISGRVFDTIEADGWKPLRRQLLDRALDGLRSDVMQHSVESRLKIWFPQRINDAWRVYEAMLAWPRDEDTFQSLLGGLRSEDASSRGVAAEVLSRLFSEDPRRGEQLKGHLYSAGDSQFTTSILHTLWMGWPSLPGLSGLLSLAAKSREPEMMLVGIGGRIERGDHKSEERDGLLGVASGRLDFLAEWSGLIAGALIKGWPQDLAIKKLSLSSLRSDDRREQSIEPAIAARYLVESFPGDLEVAEVFASIFRLNRYPQHVLGSGPRVWRALAKNFKGNDVLAPAVDEWLEKGPHAWPLFAQGVLVSGSDKAKQLAIECLGGTSYNAAADALIVGWGLEDPAVLQAINKMVEDPDLLPYIADTLPEIVRDKSECRGLLVSALKMGKGSIWRICKGLATMESDHTDEAVVEACLQAYHKAPQRAGSIFDLAGQDCRIKQLAWESIRGDCGSASDIARAYAVDPKLREAVSHRLRFLPSFLRRSLVGRLSAVASEDDVARDLLNLYEYEQDVDIAVAASIGSYKVVLQREESTEPAAARLHKEFWSIRDKRLTAISGLLAIRRLDVLKDRPEKIAAYGSQSLIRELARSWEYVEDVLGPNALERLEFIHDDLNRELLTVRPEGITEDAAKKEPSILKSVARTHARSDWIRTLCLGLLGPRRGYADVAMTLTAAEILGEQFSGDQIVIMELEDIVVRRQPDDLGPIIALCEVNADSETLRKVNLADCDDAGLIAPAGAFLACALESKDNLVDYFRRFNSSMSGGLWEFSVNCGHAFVRRMRRDKGFKEASLKYLTEGRDLTGDDKVGLARIISLAGGEPARLLLWCEEELERQALSRDLPETGFDLFEEKLRPVSHVLLDILMPLRPFARMDLR